jgi:hypothetical protein
MTPKLKSYFSFFLLLVFLFPTAAKAIHAIDHESEIRCKVKGEQHLHVQQHDCTLCEFVLPVISSCYPQDESNFSLFCFAETSFPVRNEDYFSSSRFYLPSLRAPPLIF